MRRSEIRFASTGIWAVNTKANYGGSVDSGGNIIRINTADSLSRCVYFTGSGGLNAFNNYWGQYPQPDSSKFVATSGMIYYTPVLHSPPPMFWHCTDTLGWGLRCWTTLEPEEPSEKASIVSEQLVVPSSYSLSDNYPNPFNPSSTIKYSLAKPCWVEIVVYNILGQRVKTLVDKAMPAGENAAVWDGKNERGENVASGVYFYRMKTDEFNQVKKMLLLK